MTYRIGHHSTSDDSSAYRGPFGEDCAVPVSSTSSPQPFPLSLSLTTLYPPPLPLPTGDDEVDSFRRDTPIGRLGVYMRSRGLWDDDKEAEMQKVRLFSRPAPRRQQPLCTPLPAARPAPHVSSAHASLA